MSARNGKPAADTIGVAVDYVHRDELTAEMKHCVGNEPLPCVIARSVCGLTLLLTAETIRRCNGSIADLRGRLKIHAAMRNLALPQDSEVTLPIVSEVQASAAKQGGLMTEVRSVSRLSDV